MTCWFCSWVACIGGSRIAFAVGGGTFASEALSVLLYGDIATWTVSDVAMISEFWGLGVPGPSGLIMVLLYYRLIFTKILNCYKKYMFLITY